MNFEIGYGFQHVSKVIALVFVQTTEEVKTVRPLGHLLLMQKSVFILEKSVSPAAAMFNS